MTSKTQSAVLHRSLHTDPILVVSANGNHLHLSTGAKLLDATGGAAVSCLGHGNARVKKAMVEQMDVVSYVHSAAFATQAAEQLARELVDSTNGHMTKAYIVNSGEWHVVEQVYWGLLTCNRLRGNGGSFEACKTTSSRVQAATATTHTVHL
jgi:adenosylmethionine-8-amino-7-oxononanoate aminotransferase